MRAVVGGAELNRMRGVDIQYCRIGKPRPPFTVPPVLFFDAEIGIAGSIGPPPVRRLLVPVVDLIHANAAGFSMSNSAPGEVVPMPTLPLQFEAAPVTVPVTVGEAENTTLPVPVVPETVVP